MKRGSSHKPPAEATKYRIHGTRDVLSDPTRPRRASQKEAHLANLQYDLKVRLERIVQRVQDASR